MVPGSTVRELTCGESNTTVHQCNDERGRLLHVIVSFETVTEPCTLANSHLAPPWLRAVGCIFGELLNSSPLFPGENDIEQLCCVLRMLGTPTQESWPVRFCPSCASTADECRLSYVTVACSFLCRRWWSYLIITRLPLKRTPPSPWTISSLMRLPRLLTSSAGS